MNNKKWAAIMVPRDTYEELVAVAFAGQLDINAVGHCLTEVAFHPFAVKDGLHLSLRGKDIGYGDPPARL